MIEWELWGENPFPFSCSIDDDLLYQSLISAITSFIRVMIQGHGSFEATGCTNLEMIILIISPWLFKHGHHWRGKFFIPSTRSLKLNLEDSLVSHKKKKKSYEVGIWLERSNLFHNSTLVWFCITIRHFFSRLAINGFDHLACPWLLFILDKDISLIFSKE